jgi:hypothetical protein
MILVVKARGEVPTLADRAEVRKRINEEKGKERHWDQEAQEAAELTGSCKATKPVWIFRSTPLHTHASPDCYFLG